MIYQPGTDLLQLVETLEAWCSGVDVTVYLFGSRVRGDHRADSDVDLLIIFSKPTDAAVDWQDEQEKTYYAAIQKLLPGRIALLDPDDAENKALVAAVKAGPVVLKKGNVKCVYLGPKPRR
jgi:predicted nucleotidyltransferase